MLGKPSLAALAAVITSMSIGSAAEAASPWARSDAINPIVSRLLRAHNAERARVGVPPLAWDPALAVAAASYGPALAAKGRLEHSPKGNRPGQRENLWMGTRGYFSPEQMVGAWIAERSYYRPGVFPAVSRTGSWHDVGHYTQLVWRSTTRVGCAVYSSSRMDYLICRYSPPGNIDGRAVI